MLAARPTIFCAEQNPRRGHAAVDQPPVGVHRVVQRRRVGVFRGQPVVHGDAVAAHRLGQPAGVFHRALGGAEHVAAAVEVQHGGAVVGGGGAGGAHAQRFHAAQLGVLHGQVVRGREVGGQEAVVAFAHAVVAARHVLGGERGLPHIEGALAFRALHLLVFAGGGQALHLTGRTLHLFQHVVIPDERPGGLGHRVDVLHAFPAAVARLDALRLGLVHQLDHGAGAGLNPGGARAAGTRQAASHTAARA